MEHEILELEQQTEFLIKEYQSLKQSFRQLQQTHRALLEEQHSLRTKNVHASEKIRQVLDRLKSIEAVEEIHE